MIRNVSYTQTLTILSLDVLHDCDTKTEIKRKKTEMEKLVIMRNTKSFKSKESTNVEHSYNILSLTCIKCLL